MSSQTGCVDGQFDYRNHQQHSGTDASKRTQKRKRFSSVPFTMTAEQRQARIDSLRQELDGLFAYYKEAMTPKLVLDFSHCASTNALIAYFMEESHLPLSRLVSQIYDNLKDAQNAFVREPLTLASIKTSVLSVGQRFMYGVPNADADVLEDDSESCLWCWETRDIRLLPKPLRGDFNVRRICRKRIHERIAAVSAMASALEKSDGENNCKYDLIRATEKLDKTFCVEDIRSLVDQLFQQKSADMAEKETKRQEKLLVRQMEKSKREIAKEKGMDNELKMEKSQIEQMEQEKHNEMEVPEMRKQSGKQLEESEKHQRRREKEMAELKKKLSLQKQVSIMERFLKRTKTSGSCKHDQFPNKATNFGSSGKKIQNVSEAVTLFIDSALTSTVEIINDDILKSHLSSWHSLAQCIRSNRKQHWGLRRKPKTELFKELKLTDAKEYVGGDDLNTEKLVDGWPEPIMADKPCFTKADTSNTKLHYRRKQLLQFDNSPRPAFYGIWPKKSNIVGARHPFRKDPDLDYDIDSDEEWEEEESGESLSDCEIDEENLEECSKSDSEDDPEDGFFVPDGYLSENEGAQVDRINMEIDIEAARSSPDCEQDTEDREFCALLQQEKFLNNLTEHALRKNQPYIVLDLMHDKASLLIAQSTIDTLKLEEKCLQALRMWAMPGCSTIGVPGDDMEKDKESLSSFSKVCTPILDVTSVPESELSTVVSAIQSCSQGMSKVLDCLQQKFPAVPKSLLKIKVREVSYFADNHWQVKKEVLDKLRLASSPEKRNGETRSISTFFSKRCLPPTGERY